MFNISHVHANQKIKIDEDRQFLMLQKQGRNGSLGAIDKKLVDREQRSLERRMQEKQRAASASSTTAASVELL